MAVDANCRNLGDEVKSAGDVKDAVHHQAHIQLSKSGDALLVGKPDVEFPASWITVSLFSHATEHST